MTVTIQQIARDLAAATDRIAALELRGVDQGAFRLLFTFAERQAEVLVQRQAEAIVAQGWPEPEDEAAMIAFGTAAAYLTMRADFEQASRIDFEDPDMVASLAAALQFYVEAFGIIEAHRPAEIFAALGIAQA